MGLPNCHRWRAFQRRAETLHRAAASLFCDLLREAGEDHETTDYADNTIVELDALISSMNRAAERSKSPGRRNNPNPHRGE